MVEKSSSSLGGKGGKAATTTGSSALSSSSSSSLSPEMDKLRICKEDFEAAKISFQQVHDLPTLPHSTLHLLDPFRDSVIFNFTPPSNLYTALHCTMQSESTAQCA